MARLRLATIWLGGCSGCHMSFLDLDEWLVELAQLADVVYSPLVDVKEFPEGVDVVLVEGAVANEDNERLLRTARARSRLLVSFGDCAVTGNVTALRNPLGKAEVVLRRSYLDPANDGPRLPHAPGILPPLIDAVRPLHHLVPVDLYLPGCPPTAARIREVLESLTAGRVPVLQGEQIRFG
jgi:NAD-reducing hydrogenase small subunit